MIWDGAVVLEKATPGPTLEILPSQEVILEEPASLIEELESKIPEFEEAWGEQQLDPVPPIVIPKKISTSLYEHPMLSVGLVNRKRPHA